MFFCGLCTTQPCRKSNSLDGRFGRVLIDDDSDYATKVFGFSTFGRVYGAIICISGVINFSQTGLDALTQGALKGNPIPINGILTVLSFVIGTILVIFVQVESRRWSAEEMEAERQRLLDEVEEESEEEYD